MDEVKYIIGSLVDRANDAIKDRAKTEAEKQRQIDELQTFFQQTAKQIVSRYQKGLNALFDLNNATYKFSIYYGNSNINDFFLSVTRSYLLNHRYNKNQEVYTVSVDIQNGGFVIEMIKSCLSENEHGNFVVLDETHDSKLASDKRTDCLEVLKERFNLDEFGNELAGKLKASIEKYEEQTNEIKKQ